MSPPPSPRLHSPRRLAAGSPNSFHDTQAWTHSSDADLKDEDVDEIHKSGGELGQQSWRHLPWEVKDNLPAFLHSAQKTFSLNIYNENLPLKTLWLPLPRDFHDLVQIMKDHGTVPQFYRIPHVMGFSEFLGYPWRHRKKSLHITLSLGQIMRDDQGIFRSIISASLNTGRAPLCAPDYFFIPNDWTRQSVLRDMFQEARKQTLDIAWNHSIKVKEPVDHIDWIPFCDYIRAQVPTAEFLFKKDDVWNEAWFIRSVSELNVEIPVCKEAIHLMRSAGYRITPKKRWIGKDSWLLADEAVIRQEVFKHWMHWRKKSEEHFERLKPDLIRF